MLREESKQLSFYCSLYEKIPETHILKRIEKVVDLGFINEMLESSYCKHFGRPAKEPEMMMGKTGEVRQGTVLCLIGKLNQN